MYVQHYHLSFHCISIKCQISAQWFCRISLINLQICLTCWNWFWFIPILNWTTLKLILTGILHKTWTKNTMILLQWFTMIFNWTTLNLVLTGCVYSTDKAWAADRDPSSARRGMILKGVKVWTNLFISATPCCDLFGSDSCAKIQK